VAVISRLRPGKENVNKPRMVGINHIAPAVGDIDEAPTFWNAIFDFEPQSRLDDNAFLDMGDQFIALMMDDLPTPDVERHFGLVVDGRSRVLELAEAAGATIIKNKRVDFFDPWGNRIQMVDYRGIKFSKTDGVLRGMRLDLDKSPEAIGKLRD